MNNTQSLWADHDLAEFFWICKVCDADASVEAAKLMKAFAYLEASE